MSAYFSPQRVHAFIQTWQTASQDPSPANLAACQSETQALTKAINASGNDEEIASIAKNIMDAMTPAMQEQLTTLIARDIYLQGVRGQADESNLYTAFGMLEKALQRPDSAERTPRLLSLLFSSSRETIDTFHDRIQSVLLKAWSEKEERGIPKQSESFFHLLPSSVLASSLVFAARDLNNVPYNQWLSLAEKDPKLKYAVIAAINRSNISISSLGIDSSKKFRAFIDLYGQDLTALLLRSSEFIKNEDILYASSKMKYLDRLDLRSTHVTDATLQEVLKKHPSVTQLNLNFCPLSDRSLQYMAQHCHQLTALFLQNITSISSTTIELLAQNCPNLNELYLDAPTASDNSLQLLATHCRFKVLSLQNCLHLSDNTLQLVAQKSPELASIRLRNCPLITDRGVCQIAEHCGRLRSLFLFENPQITDVTIRAIAKYLPNLREFNIGQAPHISEDALRELAQKCPLLKNPLLIDGERILQLPYNLWLAQAQSTDPHRNALIQKSIASLIHEDSPNVHSLGISNNPQLQKFLLDYGYILTYLNLQDCDFLTMETVQMIAQNCPQLKQLDLLGVPAIIALEAKQMLLRSNPTLRVDV